jgi:hypothetical protein
MWIPLFALAAVQPTCDGIEATAAPCSLMEPLRTHTGLELRLSAGPAYVATSFADPTRTTLGGFAPSLQLDIGGTPRPGLVVGGALWGVVQRSAQINMGPGTVVPSGQATIVALGPFVDYYPDPTKGWHMRAMVGAAALHYASAGGDWGEATSGIGFATGAGFGYDFWVGDTLSVGLLGRVDFVVSPMSPLFSSAFEHESVTTTVTIPGLYLSAAYQ